MSDSSPPYLAHIRTRAQGQLAALQQARDSEHDALSAERQLRAVAEERESSRRALAEALELAQQEVDRLRPALAEARGEPARLADELSLMITSRDTWRVGGGWMNCGQAVLRRSWRLLKGPCIAHGTQLARWHSNCSLQEDIRWKVYGCHAQQREATHPPAPPCCRTLPASTRPRQMKPLQPPQSRLPSWRVRAPRC